MPKIFISYRRDDAPGWARHLFGDVKSEFGLDNVFIDVEALRPGDDFVDAIKERLSVCDVMLVVVGRRWLTSTDDTGRRRLDDSADVHRIELETAIAHNLRIIPVLVERATMPKAEELPEPLRAITRRNAAELRDNRWDDDVRALINQLKGAPLGSAPSHAPAVTHSPAFEPLPTSRKDAPQAPGAPSPSRNDVSIRASKLTITVVLASLAALTLGSLVYWSSVRDESPGAAPDQKRAEPRPISKADKLQTACDAGDAGSCNELGESYRNGDGVAPDEKRAAALYDKACDGGDGLGCINLGVSYAQGIGVTTDDTRAATAYRKACDVGSMDGCVSLANHYVTGRGVTKDASRAVPLLEKACAARHSDGCWTLGAIYEIGQSSVAKDPARAAVLYKRACDLGSNRACDDVRRLSSTQPKS